MRVVNWTAGGWRVGRAVHNRETRLKYFFSIGPTGRDRNGDGQTNSDPRPVTISREQMVNAKA